MVVAQIASSQIQVSSVTVTGDTWFIEDHWCDEDIKKVKGIAESAVEPQNILARVVRLALKFSIYGFAFFLLFSFILVFPSIVVWVIYYFFIEELGWWFRWNYFCCPVDGGIFVGVARA